LAFSLEEDMIALAAPARDCGCVPFLGPLDAGEAAAAAEEDEETEGEVSPNSSSAESTGSLSDAEPSPSPSDESRSEGSLVDVLDLALSLALDVVDAAAGGREDAFDFAAVDFAVVGFAVGAAAAAGGSGVADADAEAVGRRRPSELSRLARLFFDGGGGAGAVVAAGGSSSASEDKRDAAASDGVDFARRAAAGSGLDTSDLALEDAAAPALDFGVLGRRERLGRSGSAAGVSAGGGAGASASVGAGAAADFLLERRERLGRSVVGAVADGIGSSTRLMENTSDCASPALVFPDTRETSERGLGVVGREGVSSPSASASACTEGTGVSSSAVTRTDEVLSVGARGGVGAIYASVMCESERTEVGLGVVGREPPDGESPDGTGVFSSAVSS
jgi:hypothetical protein